MILSMLPFVIATLINPARASYFGGYCAAILEHQADPDVPTRARISNTLDAYVARARRIDERWRRPVPPDQLAALSVGLQVSYLITDPRDVPKHPRLLGAALTSLGHVPERTARLQRDLYAVQQGVVARGIELRGNERIRAHLAAVTASVRRNDADLARARAGEGPRAVGWVSRILASGLGRLSADQLGKLDLLVRQAESYPNALAHRSFRRILSPAQACDLRSAAGRKHAPSLSLCRDLDDPRRGVRLARMPVNHDLVVDLIYFTDPETFEPVLVITDRFVTTENE